MLPALLRAGGPHSGVSITAVPTDRRAERCEFLPRMSEAASREFENLRLRQNLSWLFVRYGYVFICAFVFVKSLSARNEGTPAKRKADS